MLEERRPTNLRIHPVWKNRAPRNVLRSPLGIAINVLHCCNCCYDDRQSIGATRLVSSMEYVEGDCFSTGTLLLPNVTGTTNG